MLEDLQYIWLYMTILAISRFNWHLLVFILWSLYALLLHLMGSFGCIDCRMNNDQRRRITVIIMILLIILSDWLDDEGRRVIIRRLLFDSHVNDNQGGGWIIFDDQEMRWVVRRLPFALCINNNQGEGWITIIIITTIIIRMLSLFTMLLGLYLL